MKILLLNYEFPPLGGGGGNATKNVAKNLAKLGNDVVVVTSSFNGLAGREKIDGYEVIRVKSLRKKESGSNPFEMLSYIFSAIFYLPKIFKYWMPEKTIAFFSIPSGIISLWAKKRFGLEYLVLLRGGDVPGSICEKNLNFYHFITLPFTKKIWKEAICVIANSKGLKLLADKTAKKINKEIKIISNGIDLDIFKNNNSRNGDKIKILFVGRLSEQKGVDRLLRSIANLISKYEIKKESITCDIVGSGPAEEDLKKEAEKLNISNIVNFFGWVKRENIVNIYNDSEIFVLPSLDEGMPNVILEAMACGLPIVASNISGNDELVVNGENGFLFDNENELVDSLYRLCRSRGLREKFSETSKKMAKKFSWENVAKDYFNLLKK